MSGLNLELQASGRTKSGVATSKIGSSALYIFCSWIGKILSTLIRCTANVTKNVTVSLWYLNSIRLSTVTYYLTGEVCSTLSLSTLELGMVLEIPSYFHHFLLHHENFFTYPNLKSGATIFSLTLCKLIVLPYDELEIFQESVVSC